jgi:hypothetical protein
MNITFQLSADELDEQIIEAVKTLYAGKTIVLTVVPPPSVITETERKILEAGQSEEVYSFSPEEYDKLMQAVEEDKPIDFASVRKIKTNV